MKRSFERSSLEDPRSTHVARDVSGVPTGFTSTTRTPARTARNGSPAAGFTAVDVPIEEKRSHASFAACADSSVCGDSLSPNHATLGRNSRRISKPIWTHSSHPTPFIGASHLHADGVGGIGRNATPRD